MTAQCPEEEMHQKYTSNDVVVTVNGLVVIDSQCKEEDAPLEPDWSDLEAALEAGFVQARI